MTSTSQKNGKLLLEVTSDRDAGEFMKQFELFDKNLKLNRSHWFAPPTLHVPDIPPGTYVVRLSLATGVQQDEVVEIKAGKEKKLSMPLPVHNDQSTGTALSWSKLRDTLELKDMVDMMFELSAFDSLTGVSGRLLTLEGGKWKPSLLPYLQNQWISDSGQEFILDIAAGMHVLEVSHTSGPTVLVCLPPNPRLKCFLKKTQGPAAEHQPLAISLSTPNKEAEAMLALLTKGAIREAKTLMDAQQAEDLLYQKRRDPTAAAVGGYYLLKTADLDRLHDWAENLANWFPWMPDGCIIHAWQLLHEQRKEANHTEQIRRRLLEALKRGIPYYTEGLRLLYEGLTMLSCHLDKQDKAVEQALATTRHFVINVDWSRPTCTFTADPAVESDTAGIASILSGNLQGDFETDTEAGNKLHQTTY